MLDLVLTSLLLFNEDTKHNLSLISEEGIEEPADVVTHHNLVSGSLEVAKQGVICPELGAVLVLTDLEANVLPALDQIVEAMELVENSLSSQIGSVDVHEDSIVLVVLIIIEQIEDTKLDLCDLVVLGRRLRLLAVESSAICLGITRLLQ